MSVRNKTLSNRSKVRHYRLRDNNGDLVSLTVVSDLFINDNAEHNTVEYKVSFCSKHDTFVKKVGVEEALEKDTVFSFPVRKDLSYRQVNTMIFADLITRKDEYPVPKQHTRLLAQYQSKLLDDAE